MKEAFDTRAALRHMRKVDPIMADLMKRALDHHAPLKIPSPRKSTRYFPSIVESIVSQQISIKAADAVWSRLKDGVGAVTPENLRERTVDELRTYGLSRQKATYIIKSAGIWHELPTHSFARMDTEAVIAELTKLHGIGRWTAEMFLMFTLARPDVFSMGDWGLMMSIKHNYKLDSTKTMHRKKIEKLVHLWSPHRTLAAMTLWHSKDAS